MRLAVAGDYSLSGLAVPESLELLHGLLDQVRSDCPHLDETHLSMFETAIVEIHGNVIEHGRPRGQLLYTFGLKVHDDKLVGVLTDNGVADPDLSELEALPNEVSESGRGLWLARATLDELEHARIDGRNTWTLTRYLNDDR
jgi:serine/threonine-protein kinase RsbW